MPDLNPATCKSCGAPILWGRTAAGKAMPLDATPQKRAIVGRSGALHVVDTFMPHWASCPNASEHRRRDG